MSYLAQASLAGDELISQRVIACAATQEIENPVDWVADRIWQLSAQPGWAEAFASATLLHESWSPSDTDPSPRPPSPGANEAAVTDGMILAAVQSLHQAENEEEPQNV